MHGHGSKNGQPRQVENTCIPRTINIAAAADDTSMVVRLDNRWLRRLQKEKAPRASSFPPQRTMSLGVAKTANVEQTKRRATHISKLAVVVGDAAEFVSNDLKVVFHTVAHLVLKFINAPSWAKPIFSAIKERYPAVTVLELESSPTAALGRWAAVRSHAEKTPRTSSHATPQRTISLDVIETPSAEQTQRRATRTPAHFGGSSCKAASWVPPVSLEPPLFASPPSFPPSLPLTPSPTPSLSTVPYHYPLAIPRSLLPPSLGLILAPSGFTSPITSPIVSVTFPWHAPVVLHRAAPYQ
ncbi:hypothetical protein C8Q74DRAFT_1434865 [Fomes fomentarius]|nr:hypothetical protein C8Q74DRAFT_1434865 [Fomes fomentarius]